MVVFDEADGGFARVAVFCGNAETAKNLCPEDLRWSFYWAEMKGGEIDLLPSKSPFLPDEEGE
ncbi:MAG: hypothetical protein AAB846_01700 [Patescibacteria group bacterium]